MPPPLHFVAVKARPSKTCSQPSSMMTTTRWSPPSHRKSKTNSKHSWQQKTPALHLSDCNQHKKKAASLNARCLSFLVPFSLL